MILKIFAFVFFSYDFFVFACGNDAEYNHHSRDEYINLQKDPIRLLVWNAYKHSRKDFGDDLTTLSREHDLVLIQEALYPRDDTAYLHAIFAQPFTFFKSFDVNSKQQTGVLTSAPWRSSQISRIVSCDTEPLSATPKVAGYMQFPFEDTESGALHVVNIHALNFNLGQQFLRQIQELVDFLKNKAGPMIVAGDFNTWSNWRMAQLRKLFDSLGLVHHEVSGDPRYQKLDHIFTRGFRPDPAQVLTHYTSSDHFPLSVELVVR